MRFPDHGIIGEEVSESADPDCEYVWVVDPIDGTSNFVNGFPLFASSIGVLHQGRPIIGAVWLIVLYCFKGNRGVNRFGEDPLSLERNDALTNI